ncbi:hypothetical protein BRAS3843_720024 [Bradyrhizobium sp. STM 3843]|nr:hypothetical protein BRAS3843_720024 [Bradyrhizobium sp. STM 3843]
MSESEIRVVIPHVAVAHASYVRLFVSGDTGLDLLGSARTSLSCQRVRKEEFRKKFQRDLACPDLHAKIF